MTDCERIPVNVCDLWMLKTSKSIQWLNFLPEKKIVVMIIMIIVYDTNKILKHNNFILTEV